MEHGKGKHRPRQAFVHLQVRLALEVDLPVPDQHLHDKQGQDGEAPRNDDLERGRGQTEVHVDPFERSRWEDTRSQFLEIDENLPVFRDVEEAVPPNRGEQMRLTRNRVLAAAALAFSLMLVGCATPPSTPPSIRGVVTQPSKGSGAILVVWGEDLGVEKAEFDAASIRLADKGVMIVDGKKTSIEDLKAGDLVEAWFTGPVAESYPVQAGASRIEKTGSYKGALPEPPGLKSPLEQPE